MAGTPDPALGSSTVTAAVACLVALAVTVTPLVLAARDRLPSPRRLAAVGGLAYALVCLGSWAGARLLTDAFVRSMVADHLVLAGFLLLGALVLTVQAAIPLYLYASERLYAPLAALFAVTVLVQWVFLRVRGESDPLGLYALFFGPLVAAALLVVGVAEVGVRRAVAAVGR